MLKFLKIVFVFLLFYNLSFASSKVEDVFLDINKNYIYHDELQSLYDNGFFHQSEKSNFSSTEVISSLEFQNIISKYNTTNTYFCSDGTKNCLEDKGVTFQKALEILLVNSGLFSINENNDIISQIGLGKITDNLSKDVGVKNNDGTIYYYYGFLRKSLNISYSEFDIFGKEKSYQLVKIDSNSNINPKKYLSKEEFLNIFYVIYKLKPFGSTSLTIEETLKIDLSLIDTDKDLIFDDVDKCLSIKGDKNNFGCPIFDETCLFDSELDTCKSGFTCGKSGYCEVSEEKDLVGTCIYPKNSSSVFGNVICNSCPCEYKFDFLATLRKCDRVFSAVVSPDGEDIYSKVELYQIPYEK